MRELERESHFTLDENAMFFECAYSCDNALFLQLDDRSFLSLILATLKKLEKAFSLKMAF